MRRAFLRYRPAVSLLAAGLVIDAAIQTYHFSVWVVILAVLQFWICGLTMLWNDLADRHLDISKGRSMSEDEYSHLRHSAVWQWRMSALAVLVYGLVRCLDHPWSAVWQVALLLSQIAIGVWIYNRMRPYYPLNNIIVGVTAASPTLLMVPTADRNLPMVLGMFASVTILIVIRETLKDIWDIKADEVGGKDTLPLRVGPFRAFSVMTGKVAPYFVPWPMAIGMWMAGRGHETYLLFPLFLVFGWGLMQPASETGMRSKGLSAEAQYQRAGEFLDVWMLFAVVAWWFHPAPWLNTILGATVLFFAMAAMSLFLLAFVRLLYRQHQES